MGTRGYEYASELTYQPTDVILEVGSGASTVYLSKVGPLVVSIDAASDLPDISNVEPHRGYAEAILQNWDRPIGFAWLDGWDWPYSGNPPSYYAAQQRSYEERGQEYSQRASLLSHLAIAEAIAPHARVVAFDDSWRTHRPVMQGGLCTESVPPATPPAPALAMDQAVGHLTCRLSQDHPHHDTPERGWSGKGGEAIPYLLDHGFRVLEYGLGLVILERGSDPA